MFDKEDDVSISEYKDCREMEEGNTKKKSIIVEEICFGIEYNSFSRKCKVCRYKVKCNKSNQQRLKELNFYQPLSNIQEDIIETIIKNPNCTKNELADIMNRPPTTVYDNLKLLQDKFKIKSYKLPSNKRGRPRTLYIPIYLPIKVIK